MPVKTIPWSVEIRDLGKGFCINKSTVEQIIKTVRQKYHGRDNNYMYDRAYSLLKPHIERKLA